jgi:FkbM family methyltransferase
MKTIPNDVGISSELILYAVHEPLTTRIISNEVKEGMVCFDIGSNIGYYALLESNLVKENGKIFAFEPSPVNFSAFLSNVELNECKNIMMFNFAMGKKNEELEFIISRESNWSKIRNENDLITSQTEVVNVPVKTLDSFCEENKIEKIDLVRLDVEGHERKIIEGALTTLRKFHPKLMVEIHKMYLGTHETREILIELKKIGYEIKFYIPRLFDAPIIGTMNDIKKYAMDELLLKLDKGQIPDVFQLMLVSKEKQ